jgi:hypothetical protein
MAKLLGGGDGIAVLLPDGFRSLVLQRRSSCGSVLLFVLCSFFLLSTPPLFFSFPSSSLSIGGGGAGEKRATALGLERTRPGVL